jgi:predicted GTPase
MAAQHLLGLGEPEETGTTFRANAAIKAIFEQRAPSTPSGRRRRVYYATQIDVSPPTIVLVVNNPAYLDEAYQRFMLNRMREILPYSQVPIRLIIRPRTKEGQERQTQEHDTPGTQRSSSGKGQRKARP